LGWNLKPVHAVLRDQSASALDSVGRAGSDAREGDQDVRVRGGGLGDLLVRDRRDPLFDSQSTVKTTAAIVRSR
jgi:hypothetical protein